MQLVRGADDEVQAAIRAARLEKEEQRLLDACVQYPSQAPQTPVLIHGSAGEALELIIQDVESMFRADEFKLPGDGDAGYGAILWGKPGNGKTLVAQVSCLCTLLCQHHLNKACEPVSYLNHKECPQQSCVQNACVRRAKLQCTTIITERICLRSKWKVV